MSKKVPNPKTNADFDTSLHITKFTGIPRCRKEREEPSDPD
jgi:hypothetical protein